MGKNNNRIVPAALIIANLVIWPLFIIPGIVGIFQSAQKPDELFEPETTGPKLPAEAVQQKVDILNLRNPFFFRDDVQVQKPVHNGIKTNNTVSKPPVNVNKFVSKFRLKSVVQANNKFVASLEEIPHYGTDQNRNTPYSYRFGSDPDVPESVSYVVTEGDELLGEKVVKIGENYLILSKTGQYYKLTFSGGNPVQQP